MIDNDYSNISTSKLLDRAGYRHEKHPGAKGRKIIHKETGEFIGLMDCFEAHEFAKSKLSPSLPTP